MKILLSVACCVRSFLLALFCMQTDMMDQDMMEQNVQTFIAWTHGAHPTWLQYHDAREFRAQCEGPAPGDPSTYREWCRFYHFEVCWPCDSTANTTLDSFTQPVSYASFYTWQYRDWCTRGYQRLGNPHPSIARPAFFLGSPDLMYAGLSSSSASVSDGGWRPPSPPCDPEFDWGE